jgi:hypothetical protein
MNGPFPLLLGAALMLTAVPAFATNRTVHVFVALADNKSQGIVPVPAALGNGDDAANNLYWGALYGVKTFLRKSTNWELCASTNNPAPGVLERCEFRHKASGTRLVADAYRGAEIKAAITNFINAAGGAGASADLVAYVGHDGLMDFAIEDGSLAPPKAGRDAIVLACLSRKHFAPWLTRAKARPLLLTTGLMSPEAYTLEAALEGWIAGEDANRIRRRAAAAYDRYQKCGLRGARRLFAAEEDAPENTP